MSNKQHIQESLASLFRVAKKFSTIATSAPRRMDKNWEATHTILYYTIKKIKGLLLCLNS